MLARKRDNYTCQLCGVHEEEWHKQMDVHHIINYREFEDKDEANQLDNLVCLCNKCHSFVHSNLNTNYIYILNLRYSPISMVTLSMFKNMGKLNELA